MKKTCKRILSKNIDDKYIVYFDRLQIGEWLFEAVIVDNDVQKIRIYTQRRDNWQVAIITSERFKGDLHSYLYQSFKDLSHTVYEYKKDEVVQEVINDFFIILQFPRENCEIYGRKIIADFSKKLCTWLEKQYVALIEIGRQDRNADKTDKLECTEEIVFEANVIDEDGRTIFQALRSVVYSAKKFFTSKR